jgi:hypothetical protein
MLFLDVRELLRVIYHLCVNMELSAKKMCSYIQRRLKYVMAYVCPDCDWLNLSTKHVAIAGQNIAEC